MLNRGCTDISKKHVAAVFERVFGYGLSVDPTTFEGPIAAKSDENYAHDGEVLTGPLDPAAVEGGRVYQRLIDNTAGDEALDLRTPVYGGEIPFVYIKRRPVASRFSANNTTVELYRTEDIFTPEERSALARFAREMSLDYGELDVLRDNVDGRIYVVDVANTPAGPPNGVSEEVERAAVRRLAEWFAELVERGEQAPGGAAIRAH